MHAAPNGTTVFSLVATSSSLALQPQETRDFTVFAALAGTWPAMSTLVDATLSFMLSNPNQPTVSVDLTADATGG